MNMVDVEKRNEEKKKNAKKFAVILHHDVDGLTSGAEVVRELGLENFENVLFVPQDPNEEFPEVYADEVFVVDVAVTPKTWGSLQNLKAKKIVWIDHHKPFQELSALNFPANVQVILDPTSPSAVMLVQKVFNLNDEIAQKIVDLGTKADTWRIDSLVKDWMDLDTSFSYYQKDKTILIQKLARGEFEITGELKEFLERYRAEKEEAKKELLKNTIIYNVRGHSVAIGFSPEILSGSESADILLKNTNTEVQIIVKPQGWLSFRRSKGSNINLLELAKLFGGGGHEYASGADLGKKVSPENFPQVAEEIFEKISSVL
jgi:oligoribonuclease NrnB/cAMP/cGMP phosphodiesterase (DHH superfamily)